MRRFVIAALSSLVLSACVLGVDWDGLVGSGPLESDSGDDVDGASIADASIDATDASIDATTCPDGAFCDDFERADLKGAWSNVEVGAGSALALTEHAYAGKGALRTTLATTEGARALLERRFPASTRLRVRYLLFETSSRVSGITPISMLYSDRTEIVIVGLEGEVVSLYEQEFSKDGTQTYFDKTVTAPRVLGKWVEVVVELSLGNTAHAKLTYDGVTVVDTNLARQYGATEFTANIGENYAMAGDAASFDIDDVQISWVPSN